MSNLTINQFPSGSISDSNLGIIGDPSSGALSQTSFHAMKDYFTAGVTGSVGNINTGSLATTASLNSFTSSYYQDSSSFNNRINVISSSEGSINTGSFVQTSSYQIDSSSFNTHIGNVFSSQSNYLSTSSYQADSSSFNSRINSVTGSGNINTGSLLLTSSFNNYTSSVSNTFGQYETTSSYQTDSASFNSRINSITGSNINTGSFLLTASFNSYTASNASQSLNIFSSQSNYTSTASFALYSSSLLNTLGQYHTTASYLLDSSSFNTRINSITGSGGNTGSLLQTSSFNAFTSSNAIQLANIYASESNYTATSSFNTYTSSIAPFPLAFTASVPFNRNYSVMSYTLSGSNVLFVPNTGSAQAFASCVITLVGDGTHSASFAGNFNKLSNSSPFGSGSGIVNLIYCYFDGTYFFYEMANTAGVTTGSADVIQAMPNLIRYYDSIASQVSFTSSNMINGISDLSSLNVSASQNISQSWPTYNAAKSGIDFNGSSSAQYLSIFTASLALSNGASIIMVSENNNVAFQAHGDYGVTLSAGSLELGFRSGSAYNTFFNDGGATGIFQNVFSPGSKGVWIITYDSGRHANIYFNGTNVVSNYIMSGSNTTQNISFWGALPGFTNEVPLGTQYHLSIVQRVITSTEITNATNFLRTRFNF